jgi:hypothetical protein
MQTMKLVSAVLLIAIGAVAGEPQQIPGEQAAKIARKLAVALGSPADAPFAVDADAEKASGLKASGDTGLIAIPDRKLTTDTLANAGKAVSPLGQVWMRNIVPMVKNTAAAPTQLRTVTMRDGDQEAKVEIYFLGITKNETGALDLGLYAKDQEPLLKIPLVKTDAPVKTTPIALDGHKEGENTGVLVVTVFGSYKADITVTKPRE